MLHRVVHLSAGELHQVREVPDLGRELVHVVERQRLGRVLHQVEDVVHALDQLVDLVAVEGRHEGVVHQLDGLVRDRVGRVLDGLDLRDVLVAPPVVGIVGEHLDERGRAVDDERGVMVEERENLRSAASAWTEGASRSPPARSKPGAHCTHAAAGCGIVCA